MLSAQNGHLETARLLLDSKADIHAADTVPPPLLPPHHGRAPRVGSAPVRVTCPPLHRLSSSLPPPHGCRLVAGGRLRVGGREVRWRAGGVRPGRESRDSDGSGGEAGCEAKERGARRSSGSGMVGCASGWGWVGVVLRGGGWFGSGQGGVAPRGRRGAVFSCALHARMAPYAMMISPPPLLLLRLAFPHPRCRRLEFSSSFSPLSVTP